MKAFSNIVVYFTLFCVCKSTNLCFEKEVVKFCLEFCISDFYLCKQTINSTNFCFQDLCLKSKCNFDNKISNQLTTKGQTLFLKRTQSFNTTQILQTSTDTPFITSNNTIQLRFNTQITKNIHTFTTNAINKNLVHERTQSFNTTQILQTSTDTPFTTLTNRNTKQIHASTSQTFVTSTKNFSQAKFKSLDLLYNYTKANLNVIDPTLSTPFDYENNTLNVNNYEQNVTSKPTISLYNTTKTQTYPSFNANIEFNSPNVTVLPHFLTWTYNLTHDDKNSSLLNVSTSPHLAFLNSSKSTSSFSNFDEIFQFNSIQR